jgi:hypothetical protein
MSVEIIKVSEYLSENVGLCIDWASEKVVSDIMPYLQEVYHRCVIWGIVQNLVGVFVGLVLIVSAIVILRKLLKAYKGEKETKYDLFDCGDPTLLGLISIICVVTFSASGVIVFFVSLSCTLDWAIFPEGQILKTISNFVG